MVPGMAGGEERHSHRSGHQQLLQQQRGKKVQSKAQRVSVDSSCAGVTSAAGRLLRSSRSMSWPLFSVQAA